MTSLLEWFRSLIEDAKGPPPKGSQPSLPLDAPQASPTKSAGCVVIEPNDWTQVWVRKSKANPGYPSQYTFGKGGIDKGESVLEAAIREVEEEMGLTVKVLSTTPLGTYKGSTTSTVYLLAKRMAGPKESLWRANGETSAVELVSWAEAVKRFKKTGNRRDMQVVQDLLPRIGEELGKTPAEVVGDAAFKKPDEYASRTASYVRELLHGATLMAKRAEGYKTTNPKLTAALTKFTAALGRVQDAGDELLDVLSDE